MGIPSYFSYIIKNYSNIILNQKQLLKDNVRFCNLMMDCNSIIYDEFRKMDEDIAKNNLEQNEIERKLINNVINKIGEYIKSASPSDLVYIAFDGVAPFAKMEQQRTRRHKGGILRKIDDVLGKKCSSSVWSTTNITPGTQFMNMLSVKIKRAFSNLEGHFNVKKIIVSGSDIEGEGEHKMFQFLRQTKNGVTGNTLIYGLDSDLIMLSLFHCKPFDKFFIYRETPEFGKNIVSSVEGESDYLFMDIHSLSKAILCEMNCDTNDYHRLYDYVFMCFLLGNDFLPHFPSLNLRSDGVDVLLETYKSVFGTSSQRSFIDNNLHIQWRWVSLFFFELSKGERNRFIKEDAAREKLGKRRFNLSNLDNKEFAIQNTPVIYRGQELFISPNEQFWEHRYYSTLFSHSSDSIKDIGMNYIEGLEWVFKYYTQDCPDWKWSYKYNYPPLIKDICKYFPKKNMDLFQKTIYNPFSSKVQLAYVLPLNNRTLMSSTISDYLVENEGQYFVENPEYEWAYCRYFWEAHPILPEISINVLEKWDKLWL